MILYLSKIISKIFFFSFDVNDRGERSRSGLSALLLKFLQLILFYFRDHCRGIVLKLAALIVSLRILDLWKLDFKCKGKR